VSIARKVLLVTKLYCKQSVQRQDVHPTFYTIPYDFCLKLCYKTGSISVLADKLYNFKNYYFVWSYFCSRFRIQIVKQSKTSQLNVSKNVGMNISHIFWFMYMFVYDVWHDVVINVLWYNRCTDMCIIALVYFCTCMCTILNWVSILLDTLYACWPTFVYSVYYKS
jgi:hypothetical protein